MPRVCNHCREEIKENRRKDAIYCSDKCRQAVRTKRWYIRNPEALKNKRIKDSQAKENQLYTRVKSRAKRNGIPFNIDVFDIVIPDMCPVLGIPIYWTPGAGTNQYNSPSVDRIKPDLGYTKGNVRVISNRANLLKSNATVEEMTKILEDLRCASL